MPNDNGSKSKASLLWALIKKYAAKVWAYLKVAKMEYIVMISVFAIDLIAKAIVNATTAVGDTVVLIPNFLNIHNVHNYAAAFGSDFVRNWFGSVGARIFFSIFAVAASVMFIFVLVKCRKHGRVIRIALALLVAGAMGNCIDRMALGYVRDFVEFVYFGLSINGSTSFYVFNIADAALVIAVILAIIYFLFLYRDKEVHGNKAEEKTSEQQTASADVNGGELSESGQAEENGAEPQETVSENGDININGKDETADSEISDTVAAESDDGDTYGESETEIVYDKAETNENILIESESVRVSIGSDDSAEQNGRTDGDDSIKHNSNAPRKRSAYKPRNSKATKKED